MPDTPITSIPDTGDPDEDDLVPYVDNDGGGPSTPETRQGPIQDLIASAKVGRKQFRGISGWSTSDYLQRAAGSALQGNAVSGFDVLVCVLMEDDWFQNASGVIVSNRAEFSGDGYHLKLGGLRPEPVMTDGTPTAWSMFNNAQYLDNQRFRFAFYSLGNSLTARRATWNGSVIVNAAQTGYTAETTLPVRFGCSAAASPTGAFNGVLLGAAFKVTGLFTDAELNELFRTFLLRGDFGTSIPAHAYSTKSLATGAMASTWADEVGSLDLSLTGSLTVGDFPALSPVHTIERVLGDLVGKVNPFITPGYQSVSVAGPTTMTQPRVLCSTGSAAIELNPPTSPTGGGDLEIIDIDGEADVRPITLTPVGSQTINGRTDSLIIRDPYARARVSSDLGGTSANLIVKIEKPSFEESIDELEHFHGWIDGSPFAGTRFQSETTSGGNARKWSHEAGRPGIIRLSTDTAATGRAAVAMAGAEGGQTGFIFTDGRTYLRAKVQIPTLSTVSEEFIVVIGFGGPAGDTSPDPGAYFVYNRLSLGTTWRAQVKDTVSEQITDTGVTVVAGDWVDLTIVSPDDGTTFYFLINDVIEATHTTNAPADARMVIADIIGTAGSGERLMYVDMIHYRKIYAPAPPD